jgi:hypothetical protein
MRGLPGREGFLPLLVPGLILESRSAEPRLRLLERGVGEVSGRLRQRPQVLLVSSFRGRSALEKCCFLYLKTRAPSKKAMQV